MIHWKRRSNCCIWLAKRNQKYINNISIFYTYIKEAFAHISHLYDVIVPLIRSPFVAKIAVTGFLSYRDAIFEKTSDDLCEKILRKSRFLVFDFLDKLIAHASLRA